MLPNMERLSAPATGASRKSFIAITIALFVSVTLNVLLANKVRRLSQGQSASVADQMLRVGTTVPLITAKRLGGGNETISYSGSDRPTVLYVFTPQCIWCQRKRGGL